MGRSMPQRRSDPQVERHLSTVLCLGIGPSKNSLTHTGMSTDVSITRVSFRQPLRFHGCDFPVIHRRSHLTADGLGLLLLKPFYPPPQECSLSLRSKSCAVCVSPGAWARRQLFSAFWQAVDFCDGLHLLPIEASLIKGKNYLSLSTEISI